MIDLSKKITVLLPDDLHESLVIFGARRHKKLQGMMVEGALALLAAADSPAEAAHSTVPPISKQTSEHVEIMQELGTILQDVREIKALLGAADDKGSTDQGTKDPKSKRVKDPEVDRIKQLGSRYSGNKKNARKVGKDLPAKEQGGA